MSNKQIVTHESTYPISVEKLFSLISKKEAFKRLFVPDRHMQILERDAELEKGGKTVIRIKIGPFTTSYSFYCTEKVENKLLIISQGLGLLNGFKATFKFEAIDKKNARLSEVVEYYIPTIPLFTRTLTKCAGKKINNFLVYREKTLHKDLYYQSKYPLSKMKIAISGTSGLIADQLQCFFSMLGAKIVKLVRDPSQKEDEIYYDYKKHIIQSEKLEGLDCVIHLAGKPLTLNPSESNLEEMLESRVESTKLIAQAINQCKKPPKIFLCASAIGIYNFDKNYIVDENACIAETSLAQICKEWEAAANKCTKARVVNLRFAPVLSPNKGLLSKFLAVAKKGLCPVFADGANSLSWISIDDVLYQILHIIHCKQLEGPINISSPNYTTQKNFAKTLCRYIHRPQIFRLPKTLLNRILPDFTKQMLLSNQKVFPAKLSESGAEFAYPHIEDTFAHFFKKF